MSPAPPGGPPPLEVQRFLEFAEDLAANTPSDPDAWICLGFAHEALAWGLSDLERWPLFPWVGSHPRVQAYTRWMDGDPTADFVYDSELIAEFDWVPVDKADPARVVAEEAPTDELGESMARLHKSLGLAKVRVPFPERAAQDRWVKEKLNSGEISLEIRRTPGLARTALGQARLHVFERAFEAYCRAASLRLNDSQYEALQAAALRFKQLAYFEIPYPPGLPRFPIGVLVRMLETHQPRQFDSLVLELSTVLERGSPGIPPTPLRAWTILGVAKHASAADRQLMADLVSRLVDVGFMSMALKGNHVRLQPVPQDFGPIVGFPNFLPHASAADLERAASPSGTTVAALYAKAHFELAAGNYPCAALCLAVWSAWISIAVPGEYEHSWLQMLREAESEDEDRDMPDWEWEDHKGFWTDVARGLDVDLAALLTRVDAVAAAVSKAVED